ncbi:glycosyl transferase family 2 [Erysipelotrichaceae bacterium MTC7]|nr:glycosyl transferase family 2 [Erysipelotrichaceae bacterium MTC7]
MKKELRSNDINVTLVDSKINGINNPLYWVELSTNLSAEHFVVMGDGVELDKVVRTQIVDSHLMLSAKLGNAKVIELFVVVDDERRNLEKLNNRISKRVSYRLKECILKVLQPIGDFIYNSGSFIMFLLRNRDMVLHPSKWKKLFKTIKQRRKERNRFVLNPYVQKDYLHYIHVTETPDVIEKFGYNPLISVLIPVYNINRDWLSACLNSILDQSYQNFEICLSDDCSTKEETLATLKEYGEKDERIKVYYRKENGHISKATNDALKIASGEFVALMDNDDLLPKDTLYEVVKVLNENRELDFIYTDEDKLDTEGKRCHPHYKTDYAPDSLFSSNYISHFGVLRKSIMEEIGGFTVGLEGAQDYDLYLRFIEKTTPDKIYHIPKILYHWRMVEGSTSMTIDNKGYAVDAGKQAIENALGRRGIKATVFKDEMVPYYKINYAYDVEPKVGIFIPTKDYAKITRDCLQSVFDKTTYKNFEVILINNQSEKKETFVLFEEFKSKYNNFHVFDADIPFNYSKINNMAVHAFDCDVVVLLNNDTEVITPDWLQIMVGYAIQKHIGAVGAKLYYPDDTVQHAGVLLGLGVATHAFVNAPRDDVGTNGRLRVPYNYSAVTAACLAVEKSKYLEVGCLEEELTVAYNDVDFNLKLLEKGYYNVCVPQVQLYHYESKSRGLDTSSTKYKRFVWEQEYMYKKWESYIADDPYYNPNFSRSYCFMLDERAYIKKSQEGVGK